MKTQNSVGASKRAKNIAAVLYMLVLTFLVGGSYLHQQRDAADSVGNQANQHSAQEIVD